MATLLLPDFSTLGTNLAGVLPSTSSVLEAVGTSLAAGVLVSGLKSQMQSGALPDPFHLAGAGNAPAAQNANNPNQVVGPTITASAYAALPAASQASLAAAGVHIVAG